MKNISLQYLLMVGALALAGCDTGPKGAVGFTLPDGDVAAGKANYAAFQCHVCHSTDSVPQLESDGAGTISVPLGGETTRIKSYGELVTSIINPSHKIARRTSPDMANASGESKMVSYNDFMTVTQLIDLVAFVQSSYSLSAYSQSNYPIYWIPERNQKE
jgi:sulfur-oxidizing protein SoxX